MSKYVTCHHHQQNWIASVQFVLARAFDTILFPQELAKPPKKIVNVAQPRTDLPCCAQLPQAAPGVQALVFLGTAAFVGKIRECLRGTSWTEGDPKNSMKLRVRLDGFGKCEGAQTCDIYWCIGASMLGRLSSWKQSKVPSMDSGSAPGRCSPNPALLKLSVLHFASQYTSTLLNLSEFLLSKLLVHHTVSGILKASFFGRVCVRIIWTTLWWPIGPGILVVTKISSCNKQTEQRPFNCYPYTSLKSLPSYLSLSQSLSAKNCLTSNGLSRPICPWSVLAWYPRSSNCCTHICLRLVHVGRI